MMWLFIIFTKLIIAMRLRAIAVAFSAFSFVAFFLQYFDTFGCVF